MASWFLRLVLLPVLLYCALPSALLAQATTEPAAATRVRVLSTGGGKTVGFPYALSADTLVLLAPPGELVSIPIPAIRHVEVSRGQTPRLESMLKGAGSGLVSGTVGGVLGMVIPKLVIGACTRGEDLLCLSTVDWAVLGAALGAPTGLLSGAAIGLLFPQERWQRLPHAAGVQLQIQVPCSDRVGVGISLGTR